MRTDYCAVRYAIRLLRATLQSCAIAPVVVPRFEGGETEMQRRRHAACAFEPMLTVFGAITAQHVTHCGLKSV